MVEVTAVHMSQASSQPYTPACIKITNCLPAGSSTQRKKIQSSHSPSLLSPWQNDQVLST